MRRDPLRIFILIAAIACLGLAMCAHSQPAPTPQVAPANHKDSQAAVPTPDAAPAPPRKPHYFEATKAPGDLSR